MSISDNESINSFDFSEFTDPDLHYLSENDRVINELIESLADVLPNVYNFRENLKKWMQIELEKMGGLKRNIKLLIALANVSCVKKIIKVTTRKLTNKYESNENEAINWDSVNANDISDIEESPFNPDGSEKDLQDEEQLLVRSNSIANNIASILVHGWDISDSINFIWNKPLPPENEMTPNDLEDYILDNNLYITGVKESGRFPMRCAEEINRLKTFQKRKYKNAEFDLTNPEVIKLKTKLSRIYSSDDKIAEVINKYVELDEYISSNPPDANSNNFCERITTLTKDFPNILLNERSDLYQKLGFNPNDPNVSRDNPNPYMASFALSGLTKKILGLNATYGMNEVKNPYTGKLVNSNCFNVLKYNPSDVNYLSKKKDKHNMFIPNLNGGHQVLLKYYSKYQ